MEFQLGNHADRWSEPMSQYYAVAMITILLYEYILLLPDEVKIYLLYPHSVAKAEADLIHIDRVCLVVEQDLEYASTISHVIN